MSRDPWVRPIPPRAILDAGPTPAPLPSGDRRIMSVYLPRLAIERWLLLRAACGGVMPQDVPVALIAAGTQGPLVHAVNDTAALAGVTCGARLADMRAGCCDLRIAAADLAGDQAALARIADWAGSWSLRAAVDGVDGVCADITGMDARFGGEAAMIAGIRASLARAGLTARLGLAPGWAGAWGLARFGTENAPVADAASLNTLPVEALRLSPQVLLLLCRLGMRRVGDLAAVPRASLARRFAGAAPADNPLVRLEELSGHLPAPGDAMHPPPMFHASIVPDRPMTDPEPWLSNLLADLCARMAAAGQGCLGLQLRMHRNDGVCHALTLTTAAPTHDAPALRALFGDRPAAIVLRFDITRLTLRTLAVGPAAAPHDEARLLARMLDRMTSRAAWPEGTCPPAAAVAVMAGDPALPRLRDAGAPAVGVPAVGAPAQHLRLVTGADAPPDAPVHLLVPPERIEPVGPADQGVPDQFAWRGRLMRLSRRTPPQAERPGPSASQHAAMSSAAIRTYFRVEDETGQRLWIFRDGPADATGTPPGWFVHGIFH